MRRALYAIWDKVAQDTIGSIIIQAHDAPAVRVFRDVTNAEGTALHKNPKDYDLIHLGWMEGDTITTDGPRTVVTGAALLAAQEEQKSGN